MRTRFLANFWKMQNAGAMSLEPIAQDRTGPAGDTAVLATAASWLAAGDKVVLAVVTQAWGSAPRGVGAYMAVREDGLFAGSISGGCIEAGVVARAEEMAEDEQVCRLDYGVSDEQAWSSGLPCGGNISVALFRPDPTCLDRLLHLEAAREPAALTLDLDSGMQRVETLSSSLAAVRNRIEQGSSGMEGDALFVRAHDPALRLVVVGAVHVTQAVCALAQVMGFETVVVDPRRAFATPQRFPDVTLMARQPEAALADIRLDARTAVITLAHVPQIDDGALIQGLRSPAFYVGALGSRRTHAKRLQRLEGAGMTPEELARIRAPVGLNIGANTPVEIALSVLAEVVAARHGKRLTAATS